MQSDFSSTDRGPLPLSAAVSADLEQIFAGAAPAGTLADAPPAPRRAPAARRGRAGPATFGAIVAAGLVGVSAGALLSQRPASNPSTAAQPTPVRMAAAAPAPAPAPEPVREGYPWSPEPFAPAQLAPAVETKAEPAAKPPPPRVVKAKSAERPARSRPARAAVTKCEGLRGAAYDRCAYPSVMAADRRLRRAYARATRAGVERPVLVSYRNRWDRLRRSAGDEPDRLIREYADMTNDLQRLARNRS